MLVELSMVEQRYDAVREVLEGATVGDAARPAARGVAKELWSLRDTKNEARLFEWEAFADLLEDLGNEMRAIYEGECNVLNELASAVKTSAFGSSRSRRT